MDTQTLKQFLNSVHTYKGLNKLNVFSDNKLKNKPLKWWLQQMDELPISDEPFNVTQFVTTYRILSQKKLRSSEYLNEILDWAFNNKAKFKTGLQGKMIQYRQSITKNEQLEQEREKEAEAEEINKKSFNVLSSFLSKNQIKTAMFHSKDDLLAGITFEDLMTAVFSNEKEINQQTIMKTYREMLKTNMQDAEHELKTNMNNIINTIKKEYQSGAE